MFCIHQILEKQWDSMAVIYRFNDWIEREVLYGIVTEFDIPIKLVSLIKTQIRRDMLYSNL
jgi:hypothetical protein